MLADIWCVTKKELRDYFSSSAALLFLGIFLVACYVVFFWVDAFFARNLADVRPLFNWIPILFIFLISALTMHSWSEERRMGTIELILTSSVSPWAYLIGKFLAVLGLIVLALILTVPLPITVNYLGELDWGPVIGGYIAALFLAAAYIAIGLWASSQTQNQIVSLILSIAVTGVLYVIGSSTLSNFLPYEIGEWLRAFGAGSRFESITRGVLDLRDIFYYLTIVAIFLLLTRMKLESLRWSGNVVKKVHSYWQRLIISVAMLLLVLNIMLSHLTQARIDLTEGNIYSLSLATKQYLSDLDKPLLIRGYFSSSTHPLLAPLVPRIRDLLNEYSVLGKGNIQVEFIDPMHEPEFEEEAGVKYRIRPVSFHSESKYQASVINTYFNVLIEYQDQYQVLGYKDLVDLKASAGRHEVDLNNPEYQITRAILSTAARAGRQIDSFEKLIDPLILNGYVSSHNILTEKNQAIVGVLEELSKQFNQESNDNFNLFFVNPDEDQLTQEYLRSELGVRPRLDNELSTQSYWFHFTLTDGKKTVPVLFSEQADVDSIKKSIISAYKSLLPDSVSTVAVLRPLATPGPAGVIESPGIPKHFSILRKSLQQSVNVVDVDLRDGEVPGEVDFLMVLAPRFLHPMQIQAIQDFYTKGGTVLIASSAIDVNISHFTEVYPVRSGLEDWLSELGITIEDTLVLDAQHGQYSLPVIRNIGNSRVRETNLVNYPYIIDVRGEGLNADNSITAKLGQVYVPWASPITIDNSGASNRTVTPMLFSTSDSWTSDSHGVIPDFSQYPDFGFMQSNTDEKAYLLAAMLEQSLNSDKNNNDLSRLIIIGSGSLFTDNFADKMSQVLRSEYRRPIQFLQNIVNWSLQDKNLIEVLRKHSQFTRTLTTLNEQQKTFWEYLNYILGAIGLILIGLVRIIMRRKSKMRGISLLQSASL